MSVEAYHLLEAEFMKNRVCQNMPSQVIDSLVARLSIAQQQSLTRQLIKVKHVSRRTTVDCYILMKCCITFKYFQDILTSKGDKALQQVCRHLFYNQIEKGNIIYSIGDIADKFYVISKGEVSVWVPEKVLVKQQNGEEKMIETSMEAARLQIGDVFGETSTKEKARRAVNTVTLTDCEFFQIRKKDYDTIVRFLIVTEYRARLMFFEDIELFSNLDRTNFESLLYTIELTEVNINHVLYREGDEVDYIYVINSGEFRLEKALKQNGSCDSLQKLRFVRPNPQRCNVFVVGCRQVLGDMEVCRSGLRQYSCICITQKAELFRITRKNFQVKVLDDANNNQDGIAEYVLSKSTYLNRRVEDFRKLSKAIERRRVTLLPQTTSVFSQSEYTDDVMLSKISNRQYDDEQISQVRDRPRRRSIRSQKIILEQKKTHTTKKLSLICKATTVPFAVRMITDIVGQKKRYNDLRGTHYSDAFELNPELPTYFRVKMGLDTPQYKCKTEGRFDSPAKQEQFRPTLMSTMKSSVADKNEKHKRYQMRSIKTATDANNTWHSHRKRATPKTPYGKYFETLLQT